jgi:plasmid maintenance system antidote protein VapI
LQTNTPIHPGEVLRDELEEIGLTQSALAKHIGVLPKTINEICRLYRNQTSRRLRRCAQHEKAQAEIFCGREGGEGAALEGIHD